MSVAEQGDIVLGDTLGQAPADEPLLWPTGEGTRIEAQRFIETLHGTHLVLDLPACFADCRVEVKSLVWQKRRVSIWTRFRSS
jgi:hypothetical protein